MSSQVKSCMLGANHQSFRIFRWFCLHSVLIRAELFPVIQYRIDDRFIYTLAGCVMIIYLSDLFIIHLLFIIPEMD